MFFHDSNHQSYTEPGDQAAILFMLSDVEPEAAPVHNRWKIRVQCLLVEISPPAFYFALFPMYKMALVNSTFCGPMTDSEEAIFSER